MTAIINASTTAGVVITPDNSGNLQLQWNGVAAPAFSAYLNSSQTLSSNTWTKITLSGKTFDTANCFDSTTNYRFTPTVAGYYQVNMAINVGVSATRIVVGLYKNGSAYQLGSDSSPSSSVWTASSSYLVYLNGSTDYIEMWALFGSGQLISAGNAYTYFSGSLVRGA